MPSSTPLEVRERALAQDVVGLVQAVPEPRDREPHPPEAGVRLALEVLVERAHESKPRHEGVPSRLHLGQRVQEGQLAAGVELPVAGPHTDELRVVLQEPLVLAPHDVRLEGRLHALKRVRSHRRRLAQGGDAASVHVGGQQVVRRRERRSALHERPHVVHLVLHELRGLPHGPLVPVPEAGVQQPVELEALEVAAHALAGKEGVPAVPDALHVVRHGAHPVPLRHGAGLHLEGEPDESEARLARLGVEVLVPGGHAQGRRGPEGAEGAHGGHDAAPWRGDAQGERPDQGPRRHGLRSRPATGGRHQ
mmetsp:Transcript_6044/g.20617  ORF Transcript_6044/g.20617 Transcript_6044/m.20617 type:complete len:307 (+) Transcript_6044:240-1160(+)